MSTVLHILRVLRAVLWLGVSCFAVGEAKLWALDPTRSAAQYKYDDFVSVEGLPYPSIRALGQSADGYLWVGTRMGLGRFDGVRMTPFTAESNPTLRSSRIQSFYLAEDGTFWIATNEGVIWYRNNTWTRPPELEFLGKASVRIICGDGQGGILIGLKDQIYRYDQGRCEAFLVGGGIKVDNLNAILLRRSGEIVLCAQPTVLVNRGRSRILSTADGLSNDEVVTAVEDASDGLWLGTVRGLHYWKDGVMKTFSTSDGLPVNTVRSLLVDRDQNLWVGTPNGLVRWRDGHFDQVVLFGVERLSHVISLFEDREGNVWGGTDAGFFRLTDPPFITLSQRDELQSSSVVSVLSAKDGSAWIGTWGGGLTQRKNGTARTFRTSDGLAEDGVLCMAEDAAGKLWLGYYANGLAFYDGATFRNYGAEEGVPSRVHQIAIGAKGEVWILQYEVGLCRLVGNRFEKVEEAPLKLQRSLAIDTDGSIVTAGDQGMARYANGQWDLITRAGNRTESPNSMVVDRQGVFWVIRNNGEIDRFADGRLDTVRLPQRVGPLGYGAAIVDDELWASFRYGAVRVRISELDAVIAGKKRIPLFSIFDDSDGMPSRAPNVPGAPGVTAMSDGSIWFATSKGVAIVHPLRIRPVVTAPEVLIEAVRADKRPQPSIELSRIPPGRGELEFQFTAPALNDPLSVNFRYRLVGFETEWVQGGRQREAHYGGLSPGKYRFEVMAVDRDGGWTSQPTSVQFTIMPFFYQKRWFWIAIVVSAAAIGAGVYRGRVRLIEKRAQALQNQNKDLEQAIAERTAALAKSNEALRASEYFYHSLVESMPQIILRKDPSGRVTYANSAFGELIGLPLDKIIGQIDYDLCLPEKALKLRAHDQHVLQTAQVMEQEHVVDRPGRPRRYLHCKRVPLFDKEEKPVGIQVLFWDMTRFRETEHKLKEAQRELVEISRLAGITEMATGVLHNIGNALNSVNTSASVVAEAIRGLQLSGLNKVAELLHDHRGRMVEFFTTDPRGQQLPEYVIKLSEHLTNERRLALAELVQLEQSVGYIKEIVVSQQNHVRGSSVMEAISPAELVEYALGIADLSLHRAKVAVTREFLPTPFVQVPKQKALQILVNLVRNACEALDESGRADKRLSFGLSVSNQGKVQIRVTDNGVGISPENLTRIFSFGFTTKKAGHGFGLHSSALAAGEMEGSLFATSPGLGKGATFLLELPPAVGWTPASGGMPSTSN